MNQTIWTYWESKRDRVSPLLTLCIESIRRHNSNVELLNRQRVLDLGGDEPIRLTEGRSMTRRADLVRLWLLREFGGAWLDTDYICLKPVTLFDALKENNAEFAARRSAPTIASNNAIASLQGGKLVCEAYEEAVKRLRSGGRLSYMAIGPSLVSQMLRNSPHGLASKRAVLLPAKDYSRVPWRGARNAFRRKGTDNEFEFDHFWNPLAVGYHLSGNAFRWFGSMSRQRLLQSDYFLSFLLRKSFGLVKPPAIRSLLDHLSLTDQLTGIEVGTSRRSFARILLQQRPNMVLYQTPSGGLTQKDGLRQRHGIRKIRQETKPFRDRVIPWRNENSQPTAKHLDFAVIHNVKMEGLESWIPRVKPGGWIALIFPLGEKEMVHNVLKDPLASGKIATELGDECTWLIRVL